MGVMSKRQRAESPEPPSATATAAAPAPTPLCVLANWCDDQLREIADACSGDEQTEASLWAPTTGIAEYVDNAFDEFLEELEQQQSITVSELNKGGVAKAWRECGTDATRVLLLRCILDTDSDVMSRFCVQHASRDASRELAQENEEAFDKWNFDLAWQLAEVISSLGAEVSSEEDNDDEPVDDSDSDEGSDEEESDEGSVSIGSDDHECKSEENE